MPIYEYRCGKGHTFEVFQNMSDDPVAACEVCDAPVERVFHPVAVHFKGSGFYSTDYAGKGKSGAGSDGEPSDSGSADGKAGSSEGKSESKDSKPEAKGEKKDGSKAAAKD